MNQTFRNLVGYSLLLIYGITPHLANSSEIILFERTIPSNKRLCSNNPNLANKLISEGSRIGVKFVTGTPEMPGKDATYRALRGKLGTITITPRLMHPIVRCKLITHELIHVLQHINSDLKAVKPLGWNVSEEAINNFGSRQEAEAYTYQNKAANVLDLLRLRD